MKTNPLPKVSYIVPARNEERYILDCLRSIAAQEYAGPHEIIVVDNASTDRTAAVIRDHFPEARIVSEGNIGTSAARQRGFLEARGDILAFFDADVRVPHGWTDRMLELFYEDSRLVAVSGPYRFYDVSSLVTRAMFIILWEIIVGVIGAFLCNRLSRRCGMLFGGNIAVRRSALASIGGFNLELVFWGDDTWIARELRTVGRIRFTRVLWVESSARRLKRDGFFKTQTLYFFNFLWINLFHRPFSRHRSVSRRACDWVRRFASRDKFDHY